MVEEDRLGKAKETLSKAMSYGWVDFYSSLFLFMPLILFFSITGFALPAETAELRAENLQMAWICLVIVLVFTGPTLYWLVKGTAYTKQILSVFDGLSDLEVAHLAESAKSVEWINQEFIRRAKVGTVDPVAQVVSRRWSLGSAKVLDMIRPNESEIREYFAMRTSYNRALVSHPKLRYLYVVGIVFPVLGIWGTWNPAIILSNWFPWVLLISLFGPLLPVIVMLFFARSATQSHRKEISDQCRLFSNDVLRLLGEIEELKRRAKFGDDDAKIRYFKTAKEKAEKRKSD